MISIILDSFLHFSKAIKWKRFSLELFITFIALEKCKKGCDK